MEDADGVDGADPSHIDDAAPFAVVAEADPSTLVQSELERILRGRRDKILPSVPAPPIVADRPR
jgi:hypothetical protein